MTCREKAKIEHPECVNSAFRGGVAHCPRSYGYLEDPDFCYDTWDMHRCTKCWDREIPDEPEEPIELRYMTLCDRCASFGICRYGVGLNTAIRGIMNELPFITPDFKCEYFNERKESL